MFEQLLKSTSIFSRQESGQVAVFFALLAVPLLAVTSASVDYTNVVREKQSIKGALDAAVIAAVNNNAIPLSEKGSFAETHFNANYDGSVKLALEPSVSEDNVFLIANGTIDLSFGQLIGMKNPAVHVRSGGKIATEHTICVFALSEDADQSISFDEDVAFRAPDCTVHSNSVSSSAIFAGRRVTPPAAKSFCAVGGVEGTFEPYAKGECKAIEDPYAKVVPAEEDKCVKDFLYEVGEKVHGVDIAMGVEKDGLNIKDLGLPNAPPINDGQTIDYVRTLFGEYYFAGPTARSGNKIENLRKLALMGGSQLLELLALYDTGDGHLHCAGPKKMQGCEDFMHPFIGQDHQDNPDREMVAAVFDFVYGDYVPEPVVMPEILQSPSIQYINGKLYTSNNLSGELIHISKNLTGGTLRLTPGTYCGGLTVDGLAVVFGAGDYIFKDGPLTFLNESSATAYNVTFGFKGEGATLNVETGSNVVIKAPDTGPRKGLAFMEIVTDQTGLDSLPGEMKSRITSGGQVSIAGTAYFPMQSLIIEGKDSHIQAKSPAVGLIANDIQFRGGQGSKVEIDIDHRQAGIPPILPRAEDGARLIE